MNNLNENDQKCVNCGKIYSLIYIDKYGYKSKLNTNCCSKSCAGKHLKSISKETLKREALDYIRKNNEYCTTSEICKGINRSRKTFVAHGLKIKDLNNELGFKRPISKFSDKVEKFLVKEFTNIECEKQFIGLVGNTGYPLRVDFYIPEIDVVVEADGRQHRDLNHPWKEWKNGTVQMYDKIKNEFFDKHGITVCRIPYKDNIKESDIFKNIIACLI